MATIFIAQSTLQEWSDRGKIELDGETLVLVKEQRRVDVEAAIRVVELLGEDEDAHGLVGRVKTLSQIEELGAEHYMDSLIVGDLAYRVVEGYVGDLQAPPKAQPTAASGTKPAPLAAPPQTPAPVDLSGPTAAVPAAPATASEDRTGELPAVVGVPVSAEGSDERDPIDDAVALSELFLNTVN